jgi:hypothetical protein
VLLLQARHPAIWGSLKLFSLNTHDAGTLLQLTFYADVFDLSLSKDF